MKPIAVIWDIDGTLVDSEPLHLRALQATSAQYGVSIDDLPDDHFIGVNVSDVWAELRGRYSATLSYEQWQAGIDQYYVEHAHEITPLPGATQTIKALAKLGIIQAAVSNSNRQIVDANLALLNIDKTLAFSISLDDVFAPKPDPQPYLMALARLSITPDQAVAVEDSATGAKSAHAANIRVAVLGNTKVTADWHIEQLPLLLEKLGL